MVKEKSKKIVYIAAITFTVIVGFSFLAVKACISVATPLEILVHRFNFAFLAVFIPAIFKLVKINLLTKEKKNILLASGCYVMFMILQTIALIFATSIEAGIIFAIVPILAQIIASIFLKEATSWKQNVCASISVASVIIMFICGATDIKVNVLGLVILFISSLFMAISNVLIRGVRKTYTPVEIAFCIAFLGFIAFNLASVVMGIKNGNLGEYFLPLTNPMFLFSIVYLGIPSTMISSLLMSYMLANLEAIKATVFGNLSTAISIVAGAMVLKEPLQIYHIICTVMIVVGVVGVSLPSMGLKPPIEEEQEKISEVQE